MILGSNASPRLRQQLVKERQTAGSDPISVPRLNRS